VSELGRGGREKWLGQREGEGEDGKGKRERRQEEGNESCREIDGGSKCVK
jgi:hypothetical protein